MPLLSVDGEGNTVIQEETDFLVWRGCKDHPAPTEQHSKHATFLAKVC